MRKQLTWCLAAVLSMTLAACSPGTATGKTAIPGDVTAPGAAPTEQQSAGMAVPGQGAPPPSYGDELNAMDNTMVGWGNGPAVDDKGRPLDSVNAAKKYESVGGKFIDLESDCVYFTFDEGYENGCSMGILDVLAEKNVKACFFVTGPYVKTQPEIIRRIIDEGHVLGNHSDAHKSMPSLSVERARQDTQKLHDAVESGFGYTMRAYRFPMGQFSTRMMALVQEMGYTSIFWSFAYVDFDVNRQPDPAAATEKIVKSAHPGAIYLLHAVSETNLSILGDVIEQLRAAGYTIGDPHSLL